MERKYFTTKNVALLGIGIALYVILGMAVKIPLIGHIQTDPGYIAFGCLCYIVGWPAFVVGVIGCMLESLIVSGWIPIGWMVGQAVIGITCGIVYKETNKKWIYIVATIAALAVGIVAIKTVIECLLYGIPLAVKIPKNGIAFAADIVPMLLGLWLGILLKDHAE